MSFGEWAMLIEEAVENLQYQIEGELWEAMAEEQAAEVKVRGRQPQPKTKLESRRPSSRKKSRSKGKSLHQKTVKSESPRFKVADKSKKWKKDLLIIQQLKQERKQNEQEERRNTGIIDRLNTL